MKLNNLQILAPNLTKNIYHKTAKNTQNTNPNYAQVPKYPSVNAVLALSFCAKTEDTREIDKLVDDVQELRLDILQKSQKNIEYITKNINEIKDIISAITKDADKHNKGWYGIDRVIHITEQLDDGIKREITSRGGLFEKIEETLPDGSKNIIDFSRGKPILYTEGYKNLKCKPTYSRRLKMSPEGFPLEYTEGYERSAPDIRNECFGKYKKYAEFRIVVERQIPSGVEHSYLSNARNKRNDKQTEIIHRKSVIHSYSQDYVKDDRHCKQAKITQAKNFEYRNGKLSKYQENFVKNHKAETCEKILLLDYDTRVHLYCEQREHEEGEYIKCNRALLFNKFRPEKYTQDYVYDYSTKKEYAKQSFDYINNKWIKSLHTISHIAHC